jgi:hypothetical protein
MPAIYVMRCQDKAATNNGERRMVYWQAPGVPDYQALLAPIPYFRCENIEIFRVLDEQYSSVTIADVDPTVDDDETLGYRQGDIWINQVTDTFFIAVDVTDGAAVWVTVTITPHAPQHIDGGVDEIDGDRLHITYVPTYYVPDTTPPEVDATVQLTAHLAGLDNDIGQLQQDVDLIGGGTLLYAEIPIPSTPVTNSTNNFITALTLNALNLPGGNYLLNWYIVWNINTLGRPFQSQILVDGAALPNPTTTRLETYASVLDTSQRIQSSGFGDVLLTPGNHTFDLEFRVRPPGPPGPTASIFFGAMSLVRYQ